LDADANAGGRDVVERQAGGAEFFKLRVNFGPELVLEPRWKK